MSQLGNQLGHLVPQPGVSRIAIVGPVPQERSCASDHRKGRPGKSVREFRQGYREPG
jgi:hypothetical protein